MKSRFTQIIGSAAALVLLASIPPAHANPEIAAAIGREFGEASARNILLLIAAQTDRDPVKWTVYSRDSHRAGDLVRSEVAWVGGKWTATPAGGRKTLKRMPPKVIDFSRVKWDSRHAAASAVKAAEDARVSFETVNYQLAANEETGDPEWGLALHDGSGYEVGFCVISAETGAVLSENWTPKPTISGGRPPATPESEGERAARKVKSHVRKAWNWTEDAGRKTGGFFRELFRRD